MTAADISQYLPIVIAILFLLSPLAAIFMIFALRRQRRRAQSKIAGLEGRLRVALADKAAIENRYATIIDAEAEAARISAEAAGVKDSIEGLRRDYAAKRSVYDRLAAEVAVFDERIAFAELGVYEPHFDFTDSETYKDKIFEVRDRQKAMVSAKTAVICPKDWTVDGSVARGRTMTGRQIRLTLRAFNNECDAAISNARWNNVNAMEKRIINAAQQIDKLNDSSAVCIVPDYLRLKLEELRLTHEYRERQKAERDERAEAARLAREEARLLRDAEAAEEEEARFQRLLDKAKNEAASIAGPRLDSFRAQIEMLERDLAAAHAKAERARSMAEQTRSGYVYIISNVGSFGEEMVKIGLTRRLDPDDRIRELGDASVPFLFDTHAMIYSDDAPALERALHIEFDKVRVNASNYRKEFFRVELDDVEAAVKRLAPAAGFFRDREAQEYQETLSRRKAEAEASRAADESRFPAAI